MSVLLDKLRAIAQTTTHSQGNEKNERNEKTPSTPLNSFNSFLSSPETDQKDDLQARGSVCCECGTLIDERLPTTWGGWPCHRACGEAAWRRALVERTRLSAEEPADA